MSSSPSKGLETITSGTPCNSLIILPFRINLIFPNLSVTRRSPFGSQVIAQGKFKSIA